MFTQHFCVYKILTWMSAAAQSCRGRLARASAHQVASVLAASPVSQSDRRWARPRLCPVAGLVQPLPHSAVQRMELLPSSANMSHQRPS